MDSRLLSKYLMSLQTKRTLFRKTYSYKTKTLTVYTLIFSMQMNLT